jgi:hypothetical protein
MLSNQHGSRIFAQKSKYLFDIYYLHLAQWKLFENLNIDCEIVIYLPSQI